MMVVDPYDGLKLNSVVFVVQEKKLKVIYARAENLFEKVFFVSWLKRIVTKLSPRRSNIAKPNRTNSKNSGEKAR